MKAHFKFCSLPHGTGEVANVFIHGYSAGHDIPDRRLLASQIPSTLHGGVNIFGFWPSGHFLQFSYAAKQAIGGATRLSPYAGAAAVIIDRVTHFTRSRSRAQEMGEVLFGELDAYLMKHHPYVSEINLVGHSLGGRLLVSALRKLARDADSCELKVADVLLMAAAVELSPQEALTLKPRGGRLINAWSASDDVLRMCVDETCIGRGATEHLENHEMQGFGHRDYWPQLHKVLAATQFAGFQGQHYPAAPDQGESVLEDPVRDDYLLHDLLEMSPPAVLTEAIKHLQTSNWTKLDANDRLYSFTREFQLLGGHCLMNVTRGRGLRYAEVLEMLVSHFGLGEELHHCATILELEAALVRKFFANAFPDGHPLDQDPLASVRGLSANEYFGYVDALAEQLTLASYVGTSGSKEVPATALPGTTLVTAAQRTTLVSVGVKVLAANWSKFSLGRVLTNFMTAIKPGYSALIPAVAIIFFARVKLGNQGLN